MSVDPLAEKFFECTPYAYSLDNPKRYSDPDGCGPKDRVTAAYNMIGTEYRQETKGSLRVDETPEALRYMDCAEFACRVMAADGITVGVKWMNCSALAEFLGNGSRFHRSETPQIGDIALWEGHVGIVTGIAKDGTRIKLTHARGEGKKALENPQAILPEQYTEESLLGYYRPINETPDGKVLTKRKSNNQNQQASTSNTSNQGSSVSWWQKAMSIFSEYFH